MEKIIYGNKFLKFKNNNFFFDNISLNDLSSEKEKPYFLFSQNKIKFNINELYSAMKDVFNNFELYYSVKSNYIPEILEIIREMHVNFSLVSNFELNIIKKWKLDSRNMILGGPLLNNKFLENIDFKKQPIIVIYNFTNYEELGKYIQKININNIKAIIRINLKNKKSHLGFLKEKEDIKKLRLFKIKYPEIKIIGILSHYGTSLNSFDLYKKNIENIVEYAKVLENEKIIKPKIFNLGGGFPIQSSFSKKKLSNIFKMVKNIISSNGYEEVKIIFEPGRFFIGDAGILISKIIHINYPNELIINAGNHILPNFAKNSLRIYDLNRNIKGYNKKVDFYGIIPSSDIILKNYNFTPEYEKDDIILVLNCGAYSHTFSNRFPYEFPKTYLINNEKIKEIKFPII